MIDCPKLLGERSACEERRRQLGEPHILPLTTFVKALRNRIPGSQIPDFDPWDGGIRAEAIFLLETPGRKGPGKSGFISRNNPDQTAKNFFEISLEARILRTRTISWNIVPWYIGTPANNRKTTNCDIRRGLGPLFELLALLPKLRTVVLVGKKAQEVECKIQQARSDLRIFKSPHPSPLFCNRAPHNRGQILEVFREVAAFLDTAVPSNLG